MSGVIPFDFEGSAVRVVMQDGRPWFVAKDVCDVLEVGNARMACSRLEEDERGVSTVDTLGGQQTMNVISESGLYALIFTSRKEEARRFRKWVTDEVLPSIRETGRYEAAASPPPTTLNMPVEEAAFWLRSVAEARKLYGNRAARALWEGSPLPRVPSPPPGDGPGGRCLDSLLAWQEPETGLTAADAIEAPERPDCAALLLRLGLRVEHGGTVLIAPESAGFRRVVRSAGFQGDPRQALLNLPGACRWGRAVRFGDQVLRPVALPVEAVRKRAA